jgi:DNA-binding CsgD family transcriptional regulator
MRKASKEPMLQSLEAHERIGALTPKERQCLKLVAQQRSSKEIARELGISKASVDTYCNRARAKLGVSTRRLAAQLVLDVDGVETAEPSAVRAPQPTVAAVTMTPSLASLGPLARIAIIVAGAVIVALAFGMLVTGLHTLNELALAADARAHAAAASKAR